MKFSCNLKTLYSAVNNVSLAISSKTNISVLEGILFTLRQDKLMLCAYDSDIAIKTSIEVNIEKEGMIVINARLIKDILRLMENDTVYIEADEKNIINIKSGEAEYSIIGFSFQDYPELPVVKEGGIFKIEPETLKNMINRTIFSVATNEATPIFTGELFKLKNKVLEIAAVDGNRLSLYRKKIEQEDEFEFVVPSRSLNEIVKLINEHINKSENKDDKKILTVKFDIKHAIFKIGEYEIITRLLTGKFFDYTKNIQRPSSTIVHCNSQDIVNAMERIVVIISDKNKNPAKLEINIFDEISFSQQDEAEKFKGELIFNCETTLGKAKDIVKNNSIKGEELEIGFNSKYLIDALKACGVDEVSISFAGAISPIIIEPIENDDFLYLILPVRLIDA